MKLRAAIFDLYGTLLALGPAPSDADERWVECWRSVLGTAPRLSLPQFTDECRRLAVTTNDAARGRGIAYPEVYWPAIVDAVLPEFTRVPPVQRLRLPVYAASLVHTVRLAPGAGPALRAARSAGLQLGLASNCQPYSLQELDAVLAPADLSRDCFDPVISFLSFENGYSKPEPHVFRQLTTRLQLRGIAPAEILMVGDRADNDLAPAQAQGWQTFAIGPDFAASWSRLAALFTS